MRQPEMLDVVELVVDLPEADLQAGDPGTIVEEYGSQAYEIEFANSTGETQAMLALKADQLIVVWQNSTKAWVPLADYKTTA